MWKEENSSIWLSALALLRRLAVRAAEAGGSRNDTQLALVHSRPWQRDGGQGPRARFWKAPLEAGRLTGVGGEGGQAVSRVGGGGRSGAQPPGSVYPEHLAA